MCYYMAYSIINTFDMFTIEENTINNCSWGNTFPRTSQAGSVEFPILSVCFNNRLHFLLERLEL